MIANVFKSLKDNIPVSNEEPVRKRLRSNHCSASGNTGEASAQKENISNKTSIRIPNKEPVRKKQVRGGFNSENEADLDSEKENTIKRALGQPTKVSSFLADDLSQE